LPARGLASVSVVGPDLGVADAYATAVFVLGADEGLGWIARVAGYEAMVITDEQRVVATAGFDRHRAPASTP
jgi:thiamine biosynthesis lipoprotein